MINTFIYTIDYLKNISSTKDAREMVFFSCPNCNDECICLNFEKNEKCLTCKAVLPNVNSLINSKEKRMEYYKCH